MPNDPSSQPTQPLTDEELARTMLARRRGAVQSLNGCDCMQPDSHGIVLDSLGDIPRLLAEVSRLRAENTAPGVLGEVAAERARQDAKWGEQNHPDYDPHDIDSVVRNEYGFRAERWKEINDRRAKQGCEVKHVFPAASCTAWDGVLLEEVYEALAEDDPAKLREELVQTAAVAVAWIEALDRRALGLDQDGRGQTDE